MELQWPLILFTTFVAWSAGLFATQGIYALKGEAGKTQMKALITSVVLLAIGGIAVFFHLQHWERIFNGFGNLTSGITQELIAIVLVAIVMVIFFVYLRRTAQDPKVPAWVAILAIVTAVILVVACGHSYVMPSRPAWDSIFEILSLVGGACLLGPVTFALLDSLRSDAAESGIRWISCVAGAAVNAVTAVVYVVATSFAEYTTFDATYFDPTLPTKPMIDVSALGPFSGDCLAATLVAIVAAVAALAVAFVGKKNWKVCAGVGIACGVASAIALRIVFYVLGVSVFAFY